MSTCTDVMVLVVTILLDGVCSRAAWSTLRNSKMVWVNSLVGVVSN